MVEWNNDNVNIFVMLGFVDIILLLSSRNTNLVSSLLYLGYV